MDFLFTNLRNLAKLCPIFPSKIRTQRESKKKEKNSKPKGKSFRGVRFVLNQQAKRLKKNLVPILGLEAGCGKEKKRRKSEERKVVESGRILWKQPPSDQKILVPIGG